MLSTPEQRRFSNRTMSQLGSCVLRLASNYQCRRFLRYCRLALVGRSHSLHSYASPIAQIIHIHLNLCHQFRKNPLSIYAILLRLKKKKKRWAASVPVSVLSQICKQSSSARDRCADKYVEKVDRRKEMRMHSLMRGTTQHKRPMCECTIVPESKPISKPQ
jgi:hypothetical protein